MKNKVLFINMIEQNFYVIKKTLIVVLYLNWVGMEKKQLKKIMIIVN